MVKFELNQTSTESDFINEIMNGLKGKKQGLKSPLPYFSKIIHNIQEESYQVIGAGPKVGKTSFLDFFYIIRPYLYNKDETDPLKKKNLEWVYFSLEISRVPKMAKFTAFLLFYYYNIEISTEQILGQDESFKLSNENLAKINHIYQTDLIPLFGHYTEEGIQTKQGMIDFYGRSINPTGIKKYAEAKLLAKGKVLEKTIYVEKGGKKIPIQSKVYVKDNQQDHTIIIVDHVGKTSLERGFNRKENLDKLSEYAVEMRNFFKPTIVFLSQFNRDMSKIDRLKFSGDMLAPVTEDFKDSNAMAEDCNVLIGLFNPYKFKHLTHHMGVDLKLFPKVIRSIHILQHRNGEAEIDIPLYFNGKTMAFAELTQNIRNKHLDNTLTNEDLLS